MTAAVPAERRGRPPRSSTPLAKAGAPVALAPVWVGDAGRSPLVGLAVATAPTAATRIRADGPTAPSAADVARRGRCWPTRAVRRRHRRPGRAGRRTAGGPRGEGAHAEPAARSGSTSPSLALDTAVAAYLLDPSSGRYRLEDVVEVQLGLALDAEVEAQPRPASSTSTGAGRGARSSTLAARNAVALGLLFAPMRDALERAGLERLHDEVERPLVRVLARMEVAGVRVDTARAAAHRRRARSPSAPASRPRSTSSPARRST